MTLDEARAMLGRPEDQRRVEYKSDGVDDPERGTVMKVTAHYEFVAYDGCGGWQATLPEDLTAAP